MLEKTIDEKREILLADGYDVVGILTSFKENKTFRERFLSAEPENSDRILPEFNEKEISQFIEKSYKIIYGG